MIWAPRTCPPPERGLTWPGSVGSIPIQLLPVFLVSVIDSEGRLQEQQPGERSQAQKFQGWLPGFLLFSPLPAPSTSEKALTDCTHRPCPQAGRHSTAFLQGSRTLKKKQAQPLRLRSVLTPGGFCSTIGSCPVRAVALNSLVTCILLVTAT